MQGVIDDLLIDDLFTKVIFVVIRLVTVKGKTVLVVIPWEGVW